jgi:hypothetical protein
MHGSRDLGSVDRAPGKRQRARGGQLEERAVTVRTALEMRDPDGAVDRGAADRPVALGDDLARPPAQGALGVRAEEVELHAGHHVEHARVPLRGPQLAQHCRGGVGGPVDRAIGGLHQWPGAPDDERVVVVGQARRELRVPEPAHGLDERLDRCAAHLVAVEAALAGGARAEGAAGPDGAAVDVAGRLDDRDAPLPHAQLDRPVQRRRAAVPRWAGMHDQAAVPRPDRLGDDLLEDRADDQLGFDAGHGGLHRGGRIDDRHRDLVPQRLERDLGALAEAVVRRDQEEDPQSR